MRIVKLSKELGVPYEKILDWCAGEGMPYKDPEEEVSPGHGARIRASFTRPAPKPEKEGDLEDLDLSLDDVESTFGKDADLSLDGLPQTLEELDALEGIVFKNAAKPPPPKPKADRFLVKAILKKFGVENKGAIKRVRNLLPEHISRLFTHQSLAEEQSILFQQALREKIVFWCGDRVCKRLLLEFHNEKELVETLASNVCSLCEGSSIRRGMEVMAKACRENDVRRILIIGGSPAAHNEINKHTPAGLTFKLIQGEGAWPRF